MKLKKIIPICSLTSIAVMTPLITSCEKGISGSFSTTFNEDGSLKEEYEAKKEQKPETHIAADQMQSAYFAALAEDNEIIVDDFLHYMTNHLPYQYITFANDEWQYSGKAKAFISVSNFNAEDKTISCKVKIFVKCDVKNIDDNQEFYKYYNKTSYVMNNVHVIYSEWYDGNYYLSADDSYEPQDDDTWSCKVNSTTKYVSKKETQKGHESIVFNKDNYIDLHMDGWLHDIRFQSHYFAKVIPE